MEILGNFGVDPVLLGAQIVNFLIILFILKKLLYKPVLSTLQKRKTEIESGLKQAEDGRLLLEKAQEEEKKVLKNAEQRAEKMMEQAKAASLSLTQEAEEKTRAQVEKMLKDAKSQMDQDIKRAEERLATNISTIAVNILESSLKGVFDKKEQGLIIKKAQSKIKSL